ncbi:MAG TPA: tRNA 5-methoxyuridine(34)/uridine 5-oxyacetic acid(34) synthase CmoB [Pseudomonadales bacterium]
MSGTLALALPEELEALAPLVAERLSPAAHGDLPGWLAALAALPELTATEVRLDDRVTVDGPVTRAERDRLKAALHALHPWRKGPFELFGVHVDSEWRSDWKWRRVAPHLDDLRGRRVLDVGCGNGYFGWRMLGAGAAHVVGIDPSALYCLQHQAVSRYIRCAVNQVLPLRFEELSDARFDTVFSMGVIYHRRDPVDHAARLFRHTRPGGQVVLESLVVDAAVPLEPAGRYARMRNVWLVPTPALLEAWLSEAGFVDVRVVDVAPTSTDEQRSTAWMRFESLREALDPEHPDRTVEGHPAPVRAVAVARRPV